MGSTSNFHAALINLNSKEFFIICSIHGDWAFINKFNPNDHELDFIDCTVFSDILKNRYDIDTYTKEELNGPFSIKPYLLESDIKYWEPKTLGEGIFNWWD